MDETLVGVAIPAATILITAIPAYAVRPPQDAHKVVLRMAALKVLVPAVGAGTLAGLVARGSGGGVWVFALLVLSAVVVAIAQQTLP